MSDRPPTTAAEQARLHLVFPVDSLPPDPSPPWRTVEEITRDPAYEAGYKPVSTTYGALDSALRGGLRPESVYVLAGRTGAAKSTIALNIARRAALTGTTTLLYKLEESPIEAIWRLHAAAAHVPLTALLDGTKSQPEHRDAMIEAWKVFRTAPLRISDARDITRIEAVAQQHAEADGQLIIIDQLSMINSPGVNTYERVTEASNRLRLLARAVKMPILLVAQVNRPAARAKDRLSCNDLRDSGAIENDAAAVIMIDNVRSPDVPRWHTDPLTLEIILAKNRYGPITRSDDKPIELLWWPPECRVESASSLTGEP